MSHRFENFSSWRPLAKAVGILLHVTATFAGRTKCTGRGWYHCEDSTSIESYTSAERLVLRILQKEEFSRKYACLVENRPLPCNSNLLPLDPFLDESGLVCVGGRLRKSHLKEHEKFPVIVPQMHHIAILLIRHYHNKVKHQGPFFTESALRTSGYWIVGLTRLISSLIHGCVKCRRTRSKNEIQKMDDLPEDRRFHIL